MPEISQHVTDSLTAPAPHESNISREHDYNLIVHVHIGKEKMQVNINTLLSSYLSGCGRVDLQRITAKYMIFSKGETVAFGFSEAGGSESVEMYAMKASGHIFTSGELASGVSTMVELIPEDTLSRQIQPVSSQLPAMRLHVERSSNVKLQMAFYIKIHGIRQVYSSLK
jgi:hypothetical protein